MSMIPKKVRITEDHDGFKTGDEYYINGYALAAGLLFYTPDQVPEEEVQLIHESKCEIME